ncbi:hypothetical protein Unana1_06864 [Umbelopsis nana]
MTCQPVKTVGLIFSKKKIQRSGFIGLPEYASQHGLQIVHVDLDDSIASQGNFDLIVHKLTDLIAAATKGHVDAQRQLDNFEQYTKDHPNTIILDPLVQVDRLMDRRGTPYYDPDEPVIFQEFIQHDGVIFKIYVVDGTSHVQVRPSFKNVTLEDALLHFDSQVVPKAFEQDTQMNNHQINGHNNDPIRQAFLTKDIHNMRAEKEAVFDHRKIELITQRLFEQLGLTFFGFDVLVETGPAHRHFVVDVNYFPSFNNIPDFRERFVDILLSRLKAVE